MESRVEECRSASTRFRSPDLGETILKSGSKVDAKREAETDPERPKTQNVGRLQPARGAD